jgi:single-strand DNA-binding protein
VRKDKSGNKIEKVVFVDVTAWGRRGEVVAEYLHKGSPVLIEGKLEYESWEGEKGKRSRLFINAIKIDFLGGKPREQGEAGVDREPGDDSFTDTTEEAAGDIPF